MQLLSNVSFMVTNHCCDATVVKRLLHGDESLVTNTHVLNASDAFIFYFVK